MVCLIQEVPPEVLLQVFARLDDGDLGRVAGVCREWRALSEDYSLWRPRYQHRYSPEPVAPLISWKELYVARSQGTLWRTGGVVEKASTRLPSELAMELPESRLLLLLQRGTDRGCVVLQGAQAFDGSRSTELPAVQLRQGTLMEDAKGQRLFGVDRSGEEIIALSLKTGEVLSRWSLLEGHTCMNLRYLPTCDRLLGVCRRSDGVVEGPVLLSFDEEGTFDLVHHDRAALLGYDEETQRLHFLAGDEEPGRYMHASIDPQSDQQIKTHHASSMAFGHVQNFIGRNRYDFQEALYDPARKICVGSGTTPKIGPRWSQFSADVTSLSLQTGERATIRLHSFRPEHWIRQIKLLMHPVTGDLMFYGRQGQDSYLAIAAPSDKPGQHYASRLQTRLPGQIRDAACHPDLPFVFELFSTGVGHTLFCREVPTGELRMSIPIELDDTTESVGIIGLFGNTLHLLIQREEGGVELLRVTVTSLKVGSV